MKKGEKLPTCSICRGPLYEPRDRWKGGQNAQPINDGRCCSDCNWTVVIPARIRLVIFKGKNAAV